MNVVADTGISERLDLQLDYRYVNRQQCLLSDNVSFPQGLRYNIAVRPTLSHAANGRAGEPLTWPLVAA